MRIDTLQKLKQYLSDCYPDATDYQLMTAMYNYAEMIPISTLIRHDEDLKEARRSMYEVIIRPKENRELP